MQPYTGEVTFELHHMDTDSFIFSLKTIKRLIEDLIHFKEDSCFIDFGLSHELYSKDFKKLLDG